jgi:hypothetical protein
MHATFNPQIEVKNLIHLYTQMSFVTWLQSLLIDPIMMLFLLKSQLTLFEP